MSTATSGRLSRQKEAGLASREETRRRLVVAAGELFTERGYTGTTVTAVADRAGVSLQTLYLAWGSKRALLRAYVEMVLGGTPTTVSDDRWVPQLQAEVRASREGDDAAACLRAVAHVYRRVAERAGPVWRLQRDAAAVDADAEADRAELERLRRLTVVALLADLDTASLRPGLTREDAVDTALVVASPGSYETFVSAGHDLDRLERWVASTLIHSLLPDGVVGTVEPACVPGPSAR